MVKSDEIRRVFCTTLKPLRGGEKKFPCKDQPYVHYFFRSIIIHQSHEVTMIKLMLFLIVFEKALKNFLEHFPKNLIFFYINKLFSKNINNFY